MKPDDPADPTGRRRAAVRLVAKGVVRVLAVVAFVAASALPAMAGEGRMGGRGARGPGLRAAQINNRMMRQERLQNGPPRGLREPISQPQPQPQVVERPIEPTPVDRGGRPGRLTPEERRALRQQINDAGRDIYRVP